MIRVLIEEINHVLVTRSVLLQEFVTRNKGCYGRVLRNLLQESHMLCLRVTCFNACFNACIIICVTRVYFNIRYAKSSVTMIKGCLLRRKFVVTEEICCYGRLLRKLHMLCL